MLLSRVFVKRISRSTAAPSLTGSPFPLPLSTKSHGIISFTDTHPLNSVVSYRYINIVGRGYSRRSPFPKSLPHNLFADPHLLNLYATIFYKNIPGRGCSLCSKSFPCHTSENSPVSPAIAIDPKTPLFKSCICHTSEPPGVGTYPPSHTSYLCYSGRSKMIASPPLPSQIAERKRKLIP